MHNAYKYSWLCINKYMCDITLYLSINGDCSNPELFFGILLWGIRVLGPVVLSNYNVGDFELGTIASLSCFVCLGLGWV